MLNKEHKDCFIVLNKTVIIAHICSFIPGIFEPRQLLLFLITLLWEHIRNLVVGVHTVLYCTVV